MSPDEFNRLLLEYTLRNIGTVTRAWLEAVVMALGVGPEARGPARRGRGRPVKGKA